MAHSTNSSAMPGNWTNDLIPMTPGIFYTGVITTANYVYGYVMPPIVFLTVILNSCLILVLMQKHLRTPTNVVLLAMATSEIATTVFFSAPYFYFYTMGTYNTNDFWCKYSQLFIITFSSSTHTMTNWLAVHLSVQRYIYVCIPSLVRFTTMRSTLIIIATIVTLSVLFDLPTAFVTIDQHIDNGTCLYRFNQWFGNIFVFQEIRLYCAVAFVYVLPCTCMLTCTLLLVKFIKEADKRRRTSLMKNATNRVVRGSETSMTGAMKPKRVTYFHSQTKMLIVVICVILATEMPAGLSIVISNVMISYNSAKASWNGDDGDIERFYKILNRFVCIRNVATLMSYPFNFLVYCTMSSQFRLTVRQMFTRQRLFSLQPVTYPFNTRRRRYSIVLVSTQESPSRLATNHPTPNRSALPSQQLAESVSLISGGRCRSGGSLPSNSLHVPRTKFPRPIHKKSCNAQMIYSNDSSDESLEDIETFV